MEMLDFSIALQERINGGASNEELQVLASFEVLFDRLHKTVREIESNICKCKTHIASIKQKPKNRQIITRTVENVRDVPNMPLYWVKSKSQYALRVNNILLYGNIGTISKDTEKIKPCRKGIECNYPDCKFYHDPIAIPWSTDCMNFHPLSYVYCAEKNDKNALMRHISNNVESEKEIIDDDERIRWKQQTMHDLLISLLINSK